MSNDKPPVAELIGDFLSGWLDGLGLNPAVTRPYAAAELLASSLRAAGVELTGPQAERALTGVPLPGLAQEVAHKESPGRPFRELSESGLLWLINATVFHPRGFALALSTDTTTGEVTGWDVLGDGAEPWQYADDMHQRFDAAEATLARAAYRAATEKCPCDDGWVEDEGWSPKQPGWDGRRKPGDGLIRCGLCDG